MTERANNHAAVVFALPYLADYREGFFTALEGRLQGHLRLIHPFEPYGASVRVFEHPASHRGERVRRVLGGFESQRHLVRNVARHSPSVVIIEANVRDLSYLRLLVWCRWKSVPAAIWGLGRYNRDRSRIESLVGDLMTATLVTLSNKVIGKGSGPADYYRRFTNDPNKVTYAPNSSGIEEELRAIERDTEVDPEVAVKILFVGRVTPAKDLDKFITALAGLDLPKSWRLEIVGEGPAEGELKLLATRLNVAEQVTFHGNLRGDKLVDQYRAANLLTLPGKGGLVIPEALAAGLPVLVGPLDHAGDGTLSEMLTDGENSWVAKSSTSTGLAEAAGRALDDIRGGQLRRMQDSARCAYETHGGVSAMVDVFHRFIADSVGSGGLKP